MTIRKQLESGSLLLIHARELVRVSGFAARRGAEMKRLEVIPDGALLIENGIISWVGRTEELILGGLSQYEEKYPLLDASGKAVLPGFVDSHTHFLFAGTREDEFALRLAGVSYMEMMRRGGGIIRTVRATRSASAEELFEEDLLHRPGANLLHRIKGDSHRLGIFPIGSAIYKIANSDLDQIPSFDYPPFQKEAERGAVGRTAILHIAEIMVRIKLDHADLPLNPGKTLNRSCRDGMISPQKDGKHGGVLTYQSMDRLFNAPVR